MNTWPTLTEWMQFGGTVALEVIVLFAAAKLAALRFRSAPGRRALWQITLIAMLLAVGGELNGVRGLIRFTERPEMTTPRRAVVVTFKDADSPPLPPLEFHETSPLAAGLQEMRVSRWQERVAWPAFVWLAGAALLCSRGLLAQLITIIFRFRFRLVEDAPLRQRAERLRRELGIRRRVEWRESASAIAPFTFGTWKPVVVLPNEFATAFTSEQQDAALAHELAHVAGYDSAWRSLSGFVCALLWWHPASWLAKRELAHASELVADEASLLVIDGPGRLAECLLSCARESRQPALFAWLGMNGGGFRSALGQRIARLLQLQPCDHITRHAPWYWRLIAPVLCVALLWIAMALVKPPGRDPASWRNSILGTALAAAAPPATLKAPLNPPVATNITDRLVPGISSNSTNKENGEAQSPDAARREAAGRALHGKYNYENGRMDEARTHLLEALRLEPTNHLARHYLGLVEARDKPPSTSAKRQELFDKLRLIRLPEWGPIDNLPLSEVIRSLAHEMRRRDPEGKGVNFIISGNAVPKAEEMNEPGLPKNAVDLNAASVRLGSLLKDVSIENALTVLITITEPAIQYSVEEFAVVISPRSSLRQPLHTRFFKVDPNGFWQALQRQGIANSARPLPSGGLVTNLPPAETIVISAVQRWFKTLGVDLSAPDKAVFFNDRMGQLMVRATSEELEIIERAMQVLNASPQQLAIRVNVVEIPSTGANNSSRWFDRIWTNPPPREVFTNFGAPAVQSIFTLEQFRSFTREMEKGGVVDLVKGLEVTTMSGRQAQIKVVDIQYIVTDLDYGTNTVKGATVGGGESGRPSPIAEPFELGPIVDIIPYVQPDNVTIQMTVLPTLREFLGYDDPGNIWATGGPSAPPDRVPLPKFRLRQIATSALVYDGQTLVIGGGEARTVQRERAANGTVTTNYLDKALFYFITPRLVDPAGNPLRSDDELKVLHKNLPPAVPDTRSKGRPR